MVKKGLSSISSIRIVDFPINCGRDVDTLTNAPAYCLVNHSMLTITGELVTGLLTAFNEC